MRFTLSIAAFISLAVSAGVHMVQLDNLPFELDGDIKQKEGQKVELYNNGDGLLVDWKADKYVALKDGKLLYSDAPGEGTWTIKSGSLVNSQAPDEAIKVGASTSDENYTPGQGKPHQYQDLEEEGDGDDATYEVHLTGDHGDDGDDGDKGDKGDNGDNGDDAAPAVQASTDGGDGDDKGDNSALEGVPTVAPMINAGNIPQFGVAAAVAAGLALLA